MDSSTPVGSTHPAQLGAYPPYDPTSQRPSLARLFESPLVRYLLVGALGFLAHSGWQLTTSEDRLARVEAAIAAIRPVTDALGRERCIVGPRTETDKLGLPCDDLLGRRYTTPVAAAGPMP